MMLAQILEEKEKAIAKAKKSMPLHQLADKCARAKTAIRDFKSAIYRRSDISLIAEMKKASPSRGVIREDFNPQEIAKIYQLSGANAISVLTEEKFFLGSLGYINKIKEVCTLPVLRKDFIIDEYQIYESCYYGADAVLLIADILSKDQIKKFMAIAASLGLQSLVEAHSDEDLDKILKADADIIGINNRDLHTFKLNHKTGENLIGLVPRSKTIVIESGIKSNSDVMFYKSLGANAVLVGEAFMDAQDIKAKVKEIIGH
ncbi:MAG: indole-3-glycerol phosphate synthase TrpC [Candidatus Omnitrophota bacterium]